MKITNFAQFIPYRIFKLGFSINSQGQQICINNQAHQIYDDISCKVKNARDCGKNGWDYHGTDDINLYNWEVVDTFYSVTKTTVDPYVGDMYLVKKNSVTSYSPCVKIINGCGPRYSRTDSNSLNFFAIADFCVKGDGYANSTTSPGFYFSYSDTPFSGTSSGGNYKVAHDAAQGWHTYYLEWDHGAFCGYQWYWGNSKTLKPNYNVTPTETNRNWNTGIGVSNSDLYIQLPWRDYAIGTEFYQGDFSIYAIPDNVLGDTYSGDYNGTHYPGVYKHTEFALDIQTTIFTGKNIMIIK